MDIADASFAQEQSHIEASLKTISKSPPISYTPQGYCLTCYTELDSERLYCDNVCADEHDRKLKLNPSRK